MSDELIGPSGAGHNTSDDIQELLDYLRVTRDLETGLMKLSEIEKHALSEISSIDTLNSFLLTRIRNRSRTGQVPKLGIRVLSLEQYAE